MKSLTFSGFICAQKPLTKSWSKVVEHNWGRPRGGKRKTPQVFTPSWTYKLEPSRARGQGDYPYFI